MQKQVFGKIHSIETFGAVDGPGIRYIVFLKGCPFRCAYCHNPDTWSDTGAEVKSVSEIVENILSYKHFYDKGGVTISGGEPLFQPEFVLELLKELKAKGYHTALDTAGSMPIEISAPVIDMADMLLLDIKSPFEEVFQKITKRPMKNTLDTLDYCEKTQKPIWIRHVIVPGLTDSDESINALCDLLANKSCVQKIDLLPFHKLGEYKWKELELEYELYETESPTKERMLQLRSIIDKREDLRLNQGYKR